VCRYDKHAGDRLQLFENRVLSKNIRRQREEARGGWSKQRDEELHDLYSSSNRSRWIGQERQVERVGQKGNALGLTQTSQSDRPHGRLSDR
jgi:hypothetical protein